MPLSPDLPVAALQHTTGPVPWEAIDSAIQSVITHPDLVVNLIERYREITADPYVITTFEYAYIPYILTFAAKSLPPEHAQTIHQFLIEELVLAGNLGDEYFLEFFMFAGIEIGDAILPATLKQFQTPDFGEHSESWFHVWGLADSLTEKSDPAIRSAFLNLAMQNLQDTVDRKIPYGSAINAAQLVGNLHHEPALPLLEKLANQLPPSNKFDRPTQLEYKESIKTLRREQPPYKKDQRDLRGEVEKITSHLEEWYASRPADWHDYIDEIDDDFDADFNEPTEAGSALLSTLLEQTQRSRPSPNEPYRNFDEKIGRNDPCPCGSGKKYKKCCGR